jgi:hypothetical protein
MNTPQPECIKRTNLAAAQMQISWMSALNEGLAQILADAFSVYIPPFLQIPLRPPAKTVMIDSALLERRRHLRNPLYDLHGKFLNIRLCPSESLTKISHSILKRAAGTTYRSKGYQLSQGFYEATRRKRVIWNQVEQGFRFLECGVDFGEHPLKGGFWMVVVPARQLLEELSIELPRIPRKRWRRTGPEDRISLIVFEAAIGLTLVPNWSNG